jgi:hypothetical protein
MRGDVSGAALPFGAVFAGGVDEFDNPTDGIAIYNAYDHSLLAGKPLPAPRDHMAIGVGPSGGVFLYGGNDLTHTETGSYLLFDTTIAPNGSYTNFGDSAGPARAGEVAVAIGTDHFLVTGAPPIELTNNIVTTRADIAALPPVAASFTDQDGVTTAIFAGPDGIIRFRNNRFDTLSTTPRVAAGIAPLFGGRVLIAGGGTSLAALESSGLLVDVASGEITVLPGLLPEPRANPGVAATSRHVVIAGGTAAGGPVARAEIFDAITLAPIGALPAAARERPLAIALTNGQVLLGGGFQRTDALELFTPPPVPAP